MWNIISKHEDNERGGFQNRDVGRTQFGNDVGPDYGVDYARLWDTPELGGDESLRKKISSVLPPEIDVQVRNGFVLLRGSVADEDERRRIIQEAKCFDGVREIIVDLRRAT